MQKTRFKLENLVIAKALQLKADRREASPFPLSLRRPCQVWSRWTYPLPCYNVLTVNTLRFASARYRWILWVGALRVRGANFAKLGEDIGRSWLHKKFVSEFEYLAAFSNASDSRLSDLRVMLKRRQISHFLTPPCTNQGRGARSLYQLLKPYLQLNLRNTFDGDSLRSCWARWINKKYKKEKAWVKLKVFHLPFGRPKYRKSPLLVSVVLYKMPRQWSGLNHAQTPHGAYSCSTDLLADISASRHFRLR